MSECGSPKKLISKSQLIGIAILDMGSVVFRSQTGTYVLPVYKNSPTKSLSEESLAAEAVGWVVLSVGQGGNANSLPGLSSSVWNAISSAAVSSDAPAVGTLTVMLGSLQSVTVPQALAHVEPRLLLATQSPWGHDTSAIPASWRDGGEIALSSSQLELPVATAGSAMPVIEVTLMIGETVAGRASVGVPFAWVSSGRPLDISVPLRNSEGGRAAILPLALKFSASSQEQPLRSRTTGAPTSPSLTRSLRAERQWQAVTLSFSEPNIMDPGWRFDLELSFECSLSVFVPGVEEPLVSQGRSSSSLPSNDASSSVTCSLDVDAVDEDAMESALLTVVVRDVARPTYPAICRGKLDIKSLLFQPSKKILMLGMPDAGTTGSRIFEKRNIAKYSCTLAVARNTLDKNGTTVASVNDAIAAVNIQILTMLSSDAKCSYDFKRLVVQSSIDKNAFKKSESGKLVASVLVTGFRVVLLFEAESKDSSTHYTGEVTLYPLTKLFSFAVQRYLGLIQAGAIAGFGIPRRRERRYQKLQ